MRCSDCSSYRDVLTWSHLPKLRMPLPSVVAAMKHWFGGSVPPSADHVGRLLGLSGTSATSLKSLPGVGYIPFLIYIYNPLYNI